MLKMRRQFAISAINKNLLYVTKIPYNNFLAWRSGIYNRNDINAIYMTRTTSICLSEKFEFIEINPLKKYELVVSTNKYNGLYGMQIYINQMNNKNECIDTLLLYNNNSNIALNFSKDCVKIKISVAPQSSGSYEGLCTFWKTFYMEIKEIPV